MKKTLLLLCLMLPMLGCPSATSTTPPAALAPGAINQFDQTSYATLMATQAVIQSLKASIAADSNLVPLKAPLNQAISDYNLAEIAWQTYHAAATTANQTAVSTAITKVQSDVSALQTASAQ